MKNSLTLLLVISALVLTSCENNHIDPDWTWTRDSNVVVPQPVSREIAVSVDIDYDLNITCVGSSTDGVISPELHPDDHLYIFAIPKSDPIYRMTGFLSMVSESLSEDKRSAQFSGTLYIYKGGQPSMDNPFNSSAYLAESRIEAHLVPATMAEGFFNTTSANIYSYNYSMGLIQGSGGINRIIDTALEVRSDTYDAATNRFSKFNCPPILQFAVKGLPKGEFTAYVGTSVDDVTTATISFSKVFNLQNSYGYSPRLTVPQSGITEFIMTYQPSQTTEHLFLGLQAQQPNDDYGFYIGKATLKNNTCYSTSLDARIDH
jgi:hypothetical protein